MKNYFVRLSSLIVCVAALLVFAVPFPAQAPQMDRPKVVAEQKFEIQNLKPELRLQMVGKPQIISGFYSNKSVPLVVDDINRMNVRMPLPPGSYILLAGAVPAKIRHGDRVEVRGVISRPTAADPRHLRGEQTILRLSGTADQMKVIMQSQVRPVMVVSPEITKKLVMASQKWKIAVKPGVTIMPTHYAVLINGAISAANYWVSFYNDLVVNYNMLLGRGYSPANITVINADGGGAPPGTTPCGSVPVNYAATAANVTTVFNQLAAKMRSQDTLYVMITDHGGSGVICLWGENMSWATFGSLINGIKNYSQMTFAFDLCFSGGSMPSVLGVNRLVFAACDADKFAFDSPYGHYGALVYAFISALTGMTPTGGAVNADANADNFISLVETFNYVRSHIGAAETPHYNDDTSMPDATGALPQGTDGILGATKGL